MSLYFVLTWIVAPATVTVWMWTVDWRMGAVCGVGSLVILAAHFCWWTWRGELYKKMNERPLWGKKK